MAAPTSRTDPDRFAASTFTATVSAITDAFGDPTRRSIYLLVRDEYGQDAASGVTAAQVAEQFGLHPNVARHHLDKLAAGGYLDVAVERTERPGAGRPSKHYRSSADAPTERVAVRSDALALQLLGRALALMAPAQAQAMAEDVGQEYGQAIARSIGGSAATTDDVAAGQRSLRSAMQAIADALTAHGFAAHTEQHDDQLRIISNHCPFGDVAIEHPVICAVDRGMVKGMLAALYGDATVSTSLSLPRGDAFCATTV